MRHIIVAIGVGLFACACSDNRPAIDPALNSGITSSNGGGQRATGGLQNFTIGPNGSSVTTGGAAGRGNAY